MINKFYEVENEELSICLGEDSENTNLSVDNIEIFKKNISDYIKMIVLCMLNENTSLNFNYDKSGIWVPKADNFENLSEILINEEIVKQIKENLDKKERG